MEGSSIPVMQNELVNHDNRIKSLHGRIGEIQVQQSDQQASLRVLSTEVKEARDDIEDCKRELGAAISNARAEAHEAMKDIQERFDKKFETLTTAVRWGTGTMVALIGVLVTILLQVHT